MTKDAAAELRTRTGISAKFEEVEHADVLRIRDRDGRLLVEVGEDGTISLCAPHGDLLLKAQGRIRIEGDKGVEVKGPVVVVEASTLRFVAGLLETRARRIVEKSKDAYRDIEGVSQTRAGQVKIAARKTFRAVAERMRFKAKEDAKVQADKIYLG